ncbi:MAG: glycosyltransferase family 4 protein [Chloroflexi bacterium]|nr:glycosyltransferase family 4 protein [Chloroflexota bacterium]
MPRLFVASGIFHPDPGGPATYLKQLLPALQEKGWWIRVLSYGDRQEDAMAYPYPVQRIPRSSTPWRQLRYAAAAFREMQQADLVFEQSIDLPIFGTKIPRILRIGGDSLWERARRRKWIPEHLQVAEFQSHSGNRAIQMMRLLRKRKLRNVKATVVPSKALASLVHQWGASTKQVHVIDNAVHVIKEVADLSKTEAKKHINCPDDVLILTVARLQPWKGIGPSIRALANLLQAQLIVAGDGPMLPTLQQRAAQLGVRDRVHFLGRLDAQALALHYRAADFVLLYSGFEGLSHVLLEALSYGTPVLASDIPANRELVKHGENGLLIPYETDDARASAAIQQAIQLALGDECRQKLRQATLQEPERFSFSRQVERTDALLRSALAGSGRMSQASLI